MEVTYRIVVLQTDRSEWRDRLADAVAQELLDLGIHRMVTVRVAEDGADDDDTPVVAVALVGAADAADDALTARAGEVLEQGTVVVPVVDDLSTFHAQVPEVLARYNAFEWSGPDPEVRLARILLEELGIEEGDRRVFISHRRSDGLGAAEQLHDRLSHHRFKPFIDRFAVPPGGDVQAEIADALENFAFLLLLETPDAHQSQWVFDEVEYTLSHTMGVLIVRWPGNPTPIPGSQGVPRLELGTSELALDSHGYQVLTEQALDRVVFEVEAAHAYGLVRRRRMLLLSAQEAAEAKGAHCKPLRHWCLEVSANGKHSVVAVAPRLPVADDLQRLDEARLAIDENAEGVLIHAARRLTDTKRRHLEWVVGERQLVMTPDNGIGGHW